MRSVRSGILLGLLVWAIPFAISFASWPLHESQRALFESIMAVAVTGTVAVLALMYMRRVQRAHAREGLILGVVWYAVSFLIDRLLFSGGPMKMGFGEYMADIGLTYAIIVIVPWAMGVVQARGETTPQSD